MIPSVLRELHSLQNLPSSSSTLTSTILSSLTIGMSDILRKLVNEIPPASGSTIQCSAPNHKAMELVVFGTEQHSYLLDHVFKVKRPSNGGSGKIICRHCLRDSISFDLKFYYCSQCHYVRCIFCQNHSQHQHHEDLKQKEQDHEQDQGTSEGRSWATIQLLIEAFPNTIGKVFPGDRLVFHELAARDPTGEVIESCVKIYKSGVYVTDINGELPLHWACMSGSNYHTINTLITAYPEGTHLANHSGKLPLHLACQHSDLEIIKLLIAANPDACSVADNHGWIPLHYALSVLPNPSFKIIELLLATYSGSVQTPTHQGYFPLHLYLRNRQSPSLWVIKSLLHYFPFGAFVTAGEQDELPLHLVIARDPPPLEIIASLVDINPEGCLQPSTATSWSESETPMSIAIKRAVKGGDLHILKDYLKNNQPVEIYWNVSTPRSLFLFLIILRPLLPSIGCPNDALGE
jgi:ankyrin repeat protein